MRARASVCELKKNQYCRWQMLCECVKCSKFISYGEHCYTKYLLILISCFAQRQGWSTWLCHNGKIMLTFSLCEHAQSSHLSKCASTQKINQHCLHRVRDSRMECGFRWDKKQKNKQKNRINKQWEVIALERLTSHIERRPTTTETRVADDNSTWHAINTRYINSTKETSNT